MASALSAYLGRCMSLLEKVRRITKAATDQDSLNDQINEVSSAWCDQYGTEDTWVADVFTDHIIVCAGEDHYSVPYTEGPDDTFVFDVAGATQVERKWMDVAAKGFRIAKTDDERQLAFGWAYVAEDEHGERVVDHSGEFIAKEDLEDAAYVFNIAYREGDEQHTEYVAAHLVESFMVTPEKLAKMGLADDALPRGWWTGWYFPDAEVYAKVKRENAMLSIGGISEKEYDVA